MEQETAPQRVNFSIKEKRKSMTTEIEQTKTLINIWQKIINVLQSMLNIKKGIVKGIVIHHSASPITTTLDEINQWHKDRDFTLSKLGFFIGYHFVVFPDGHIIQTRLDNEEGCHTKGYNKGNIGICLVGNFNEYKPTPEQWKALTKLIAEKKAQYFIDNKEIKVHSDFSNTECPGDNLRAMIKTKYA